MACPPILVVRETNSPAPGGGIDFFLWEVWAGMGGFIQPSSFGKTQIAALFQNFFEKPVALWLPNESILIEGD
jgi:hypothetical protein